MKKLLFSLILLQVVAYPAMAQKYREHNEDYPKFRLGVQGGWGYMISKISSDVPADFRDYVKKLKSGYNLGFDAAFYFKQNMGIGIKYSFFHTSNSIPSVYAVDSITRKVTTGPMSDFINIHYIGPTFNSRFITDNQLFHFNFYVSLGYMSYKDDGMLITPYVITGSTVGTALGFGADWSITPALFAGVDISGIFGSLSSYNLEEGGTTKTITLPDNQREGLSRIDISAGVRWNF
jgi:hypothetical protein